MRGFSDEERERIEQELLEVGREELRTIGPERTRVIDITEPVGIAKPTFYRFFDSKEELYLEIYRGEFVRFSEHLRAELDDIDDPRRELERFFRLFVEFFEENPYMQQAFAQELHRDSIQGVSAEHLEEVEQELLDEQLPLIESIKARSDGPLSEMNSLTVFGLLKPMVLMVSEQQKSAMEYYDEVMDTLISMVVRGLTCDSENPNIYDE